MCLSRDILTALQVYRNASTPFVLAVQDRLTSTGLVVDMVALGNVDNVRFRRLMFLVELENPLFLDVMLYCRRMGRFEDLPQIRQLCIVGDEREPFKRSGAFICHDIGNRPWTEDGNELSPPECAGS